MIDLHHHLLPGLDDGPATMDEALAMCRRAVEAGIATVVATPHMLDGVFGVTAGQVREGVEQLKKAWGECEASSVARGASGGERGAGPRDAPRLHILPGADVHLHEDLPAKVRRGEVVTVNDAGKYLLLELPPTVLLDRLDGLLAELRAAGVRPILTHPERHPRIAGRGEARGLQAEGDADLGRWVAGGGLVQVTAGAYLGSFGRSAREAAERWARAGLVHVIATDAHPMPGREASSLAAAAAKLEGIVGAEAARRIVYANPERIVKGEEIRSAEG